MRKYRMMLMTLNAYKIAIRHSSQLATGSRRVSGTTSIGAVLPNLRTKLRRAATLPETGKACLLLWAKQLLAPANAAH